MMWFSSIHEFLTMKGYGLYVWPAWGVTAAVLLGLMLHARIERRRVMAMLSRQQRRNDAMARRGNASMPEGESP
ncbi:MULTISPECIES: heme exporter protein CcmD [unclassified Zymobacter]|uniref:heme exporter protein CcmD n=1 Tax=unclassified Zymobacter TaxID=3048685 RepID=UPI0039C3D0B2